MDCMGYNGKFFGLLFFVAHIMECHNVFLRDSSVPAATFSTPFPLVASRCWHRAMFYSLWIKEGAMIVLDIYIYTNLFYIRIDIWIHIQYIWIYIYIYIRLNIYYISQTGKIYTSKFTLGTSIFRKLCNEDSSYGGFLKWRYPTTMGFPTKMIILVCFGGTPTISGNTHIAMGSWGWGLCIYLLYKMGPTSHKWRYEAPYKSMVVSGSLNRW